MWNWPNSVMVFSNDQDTFCSTQLLCHNITKWNGKESERWIQPHSTEEFNNMFNSWTFTNFLDHYNSVLQTSNLRHSRGKRITDSLGAGRTGLLLSSLTNSEIRRKNFLKRNFVFHCCNFRWYAFQLVYISCLGLNWHFSNIKVVECLLRKSEM